MTRWCLNSRPILDPFLVSRNLAIGINVVSRYCGQCRCSPSSSLPSSDKWGLAESACSRHFSPCAQIVRQIQIQITHAQVQIWQCGGNECHAWAALNWNRWTSISFLDCFTPSQRFFVVSHQILFFFLSFIFHISRDLKSHQKNWPSFPLAWNSVRWGSLCSLLTLFRGNFRPKKRAYNNGVIFL